jgi:peptidyl-prolyl cis-trans isomerase SurA
MNRVYIEGAATKVQKSSKFIVSLGLAVLAGFIFLTSGCDSAGGGGGGKGDVAATVNGKPIMREQIEKLLKQQGQGQETKLSPMELAQARLQILDNLIQQEVMYQKAEKEKTVPSDDEVTAAYNKQKTDSGLSVEQFDKKMQEIGENETTAKDSIKKGLAIENLMKKVTSKVDSPKDNDIDAFYNTNKDAFVKKRGVKLAAIVVDPSNSGAGDTTTDDASARVKVGEIMQKLQQSAGANFADLVRENSEDPSRVQGGELDYMPEDALKQNFPQFAGDFMSPKFAVGSITPPIPLQGKYYIFKLMERNENDETITLEKPGTREQITNMLVTARKNLLQASYTTIAMNEAKIENLLAKQVVDNPNELSAARPADASTTPFASPAASPASSAEPKKEDGNSSANKPAAPANNAKPAAPANNAKPAAAPAKPAANAAANK